MCGIVGYVGPKDARPSSSRGCASSSTAATTPRASRCTRRRRHRDRARGRQARQPRGRAQEEPTRGHHGHRPHALGDARATQRGERAPSRRRARRGRPQRHHREPRRPAARARDRRACGSQRHRHRDRRPPHRPSADAGGAHAPGRSGARGPPAACGGPTRSPSSRATRPTRSSSPRPTARSSSGIGEGEMLCASDIPALLAHTRDVVFLHDGEMATLTRDGVELTTLDGAPVTRAAKRIDWSPTRPRRAATSTSCSRRSTSSRARCEDTLRGRVDLVEGDVVGEEIGVRRRSPGRSARLLRRLRDELARGDGRPLLGRAARAHRRRPSRSAARSAIATRSSARHDLVVAVSQSGETLDTLAAREDGEGAGGARPRRRERHRQRHPPDEPRVALHARGAGDRRRLDEVLHDAARRDAAARRVPRPRRGTLAEARRRRVLEALWRGPHQMRDVLAKADDVRAIAKRYMRTHATCCSSAAAPASPWRSRGRSSSRRSRTSTPRATRRAR